MKRRASVFGGGCVVVAMLIGASKARADDATPRVRVTFAPECAASPFDRAAFTRVLGAELATDGAALVAASEVAPVPAPSIAAVTLTFERCADDARAVDILLDDTATSKSIRRTYAFGEVGHDARPRALALAVVELIHASWAELAVKGAPPPAATLPDTARHVVTLTAPPEEPRAAPSPSEPDANRSVLALDASLALRAFPSYETTVLGGRVTFAVAPRRLHLRVEVDANAFAGTSFDPLVTLHVDLASLGAAFLVTRTLGPLDIGVGPHAEAGLAWGRWDSSGAVGSASGALVDVSATARARCDLGAGFAASVGIETGAAVHHFQIAVDDHRASGFGGVLFATTIGLTRFF